MRELSRGVGEERSGLDQSAQEKPKPGQRRALSRKRRRRTLLCRLGLSIQPVGGDDFSGDIDEIVDAFFLREVKEKISQCLITMTRVRRELSESHRFFQAVGERAERGRKRSRRFRSTRGCGDLLSTKGASFCLIAKIGSGARE